MRIVSADDLIAPAVTSTLKDLKDQLTATDEAAAKLAKRYAAAIDDAEDKQAALDRLGPKLLTVLESLGATPRARATIRKATTTNGGGSRLQAIRDAG